MRPVFDWLYALSAFLGALTLGLICLIISAQVCLNIIDKLALSLSGEAIGLTIPSYSTFSGLFLASGTFLALGYTFRQSAHIRVSLLLQHLPLRHRRLADTVSLITALLVVSVMTISLGFITWEAWFYGDTTSDIIAVPIWIPQAFMTLGSAIFLIAIFDSLIDRSEPAESECD